jgi:hypothetical protein
MSHAASLFWGLGLVGCRSNKKNFTSQELVYAFDVVLDNVICGKQ